MVGKLAVRQRGDSLAREEEAIQSGQAQFRTAPVLAELLHYQPQPTKKVGVARAAALFRQSTQPRRCIVAGVAFASHRVGLWVKEDTAIFRHKEHDQAVNEAQDLAVVVLGGERARAQLFAQSVVRRVGQETAAEGRDGLLHAIAQLVERAGTLFVRGARPLLQPARLRALGLYPRL